jgi:hypothetical protein
LRESEGAQESGCGEVRCSNSPRCSNGSSGLGKLTPKPYKTPKPGGTGLWKQLLERLRAKAKKRKEEKSLRKIRDQLLGFEVSRSRDRELKAKDKLARRGGQLAGALLL